MTTQSGCAFFFAAGVVCALLAQRGEITAAQLGLVLLYAAQLQRSMMEYLMGLTSLETQFVSVERAAEYTRLQVGNETLALPGTH